MRAVIAKRMVESTTTIPYIYLDIEIDAEPLLAIRAQLNTGLEKDGVKLSVNDFVLKACAEALRRVPAVNSSWEGNQIRYHGAAHVAFAVALEDGLITPVVRDCPPEERLPDQHRGQGPRQKGQGQEAQRRTTTPAAPSASPTSA